MESLLEVTTPRIRLREVNAHLTCHLCKGYYIDATTIVECLHSFCRSCIIQHLRVKSYCPICDMMINKAKPNIKPDKTLQDIVYKLVPGLHRDEMRRRREFYQKMAVQNGIERDTGTSPQGNGEINHSSGGDGCGAMNGVGGAGGNENAGGAAHRLTLLTTMTPEQRGEDNERVIYNVTDPISLSLEYCPTDCNDTKIPSILSIKSDGLNGMSVKGEKGGKNGGTSIPPTRYLQCPAGVSVRLLKKFLIGKFDIDTQLYYIDILYKRVPLPSDYKLMDIAYIYSWKRNAPMKLFYRITDIQYALDNFTFLQPKIEPKVELKVEKQEKNGKIPMVITTHAPPPPTPPITNKNGLLMIKPTAELPSDLHHNNNNTNLNDRNKVGVKIESSNSEKRKMHVKVTVKQKAVKAENKIKTCVARKSPDKSDNSLKVQNTLHAIKRKTPDRVNNVRKGDVENKKTKQVKDAANKTMKNKSELKSVLQTNVIKSDNVNKSDEKLAKNVDNKSKDVKLDTCEVNKEVNQSGITSTPNETVNINSSGSLIIDEENEEDKEKSLFLNTFELTSIKSLSPKNSDSSKSPKSSPFSSLMFSTPLSIKTSSPRKNSPKVSPISNSRSGTTPQKSSPTKSPKEQQAEAMKNYNNSLQSVLSKSAASTSSPPKPVVLQPKTSPFSLNTMKQNLSVKINGVEKPKRKYTFKNGRQPAAKNQKIQNDSGTPRSSPISPATSSISSIVQNICQQFNNMKRLVGNNGNGAILKRKAENSIKAEKMLLEEKRARLDKILQEPVESKATTKVPEKPGENPLKSLFDNCNLNIPSSLSITLTEGPSDKDQISAQSLANAKRQSPPVNMYIEIFKIPDKNEGDLGTNGTVSSTGSLTPVTSTVATSTPSVNVNNLHLTVSSVSEVTSSSTSISEAKSSKMGEVSVKPEVQNTTGNAIPSPTVVPSLGWSNGETVKPPASSPVEAKPPQKPLFPINTKPVVPKLVDSNKSSTGFQKMFEEAVKKTEAAKTTDAVPKVITRKFDLKPSPKRILPKPDTNSVNSVNGILALDLSSPSPKLPEIRPKPSTLIVPKRPSPTQVLSPKKSPNRKSPQSNMISSSAETNGVSSTLSPTIKSPSLTSPSATSTPIPTSTSPIPALNPNLVEQFNLPSLAQLRQVMFYRQTMEIRNRLLQQNQSNESLMQFENYLKNLQQTAAAAAAQKK